MQPRKKERKEKSNAGKDAFPSEIASAENENTSQTPKTPIL